MDLLKAVETVGNLGSVMVELWETLMEMKMAVLKVVMKEVMLVARLAEKKV